jgi:hypothetical protein
MLASFLGVLPILTPPLCEIHFRINEVLQKHHVHVLPNVSI